ncbi:MAG: alcohol dehydrogenase catalytic domain-containing protein [Spirochaetaceae bacterium]|nr:MAG: alcohol dehydrogenase catalytic domain-containing protein [Spirochaetaceae bacterium]
MSGLMYAIRLNGPNDFEYTRVMVPEVGPFEVLCRVESVAICGTDPHIIEGDYPGFWPKEYPLIPGHEWSGVIAKLDEKAYEFGWREGDRVCGISHVGCGYCSMCLEGRYNLCLNFGNETLGHRQHGHYTPGAYAQYMLSSIKSIARLPEEMSFNAGACMDPLSIALHMAMRSKLVPGDSVLVNGAGAQGLMSIMCVKSMGAGMVMVSGSGNRLNIAEKLGAIPINYREEDVAARVRELTGGRGAKRILECSGTEKGIAQACAAVAKGGCISVVSLPPGDGNITIPLKQLVLNEVELVGNRANPNTLEKAIAMATAHKFDIDSLVTHEFPLSEYAQALEVFVGRKENSLKVVCKPNE